MIVSLKKNKSYKNILNERYETYACPAQFFKLDFMGFSSTVYPSSLLSVALIH